MKIAALSPQMIIEVPPSVDEAETERVSQELRHLKLVEPEATAQTDPPDLENETRAGLKRLSELIRKKSKERSDEGADPDSSKDQSQNRHKNSARALELKRRKAILVYQSVASDRSSEDDKGVAVDEII